MTSRRPKRPRPPFDRQALDEAALAYVARFATTRGKLRAYLGRKLRERGWEGEGDPPLDLIIERLAQAGYVDDRSYAAAKARSLADRGYGARRVAQSLRGAGVDDEDSRGALETAAAVSIDSALHYARRRRIGPYAAQPADRPQQQRWLAAMLRAGHPLDLAHRIILLPPGIEPDPEQLAGT